MPIYLPKPLHGWRELFHEVGIVVIGILIALFLNQAVELMNWSNQVSESRADIHREMEFDTAEFADRIRVAPCIDRHIADAQRRIEAVAESGATPPSDANLEEPGRLILTGGYDAQEAAQNLVHFPRDELAELGLWYDQAREIKQWNGQEEWAWANLNSLATGNTKLGPADLALLRRDLQLAKIFEFLTVLNDRREIELAKQMGVTPGASRLNYVHIICGPPVN